MSDPLQFAVHGNPAPQGSKSAVVTPDGRARVIEGRTTGQRHKFHTWRSAVTDAAWLAMRQQPRTTPFLGPVHVDITFVHTRPASTPRDRRWRTKTPDLDKLARAVLDALVTAGVMGDDAQVAQLTARKVLAFPDEQPGALVTVEQLGDLGPASVTDHLPATTPPAGHQSGSHPGLSAANRHTT